MSESGGFFQILTHDNYEQNKWYPIRIINKRHMQGILQLAEGFRHQLDPRS